MLETFTYQQLMSFQLPNRGKDESLIDERGQALVGQRRCLRDLEFYLETEKLDPWVGENEDPEEDEKRVKELDVDIAVEGMSSCPARSTSTELETIPGNGTFARTFSGKKIGNEFKETESSLKKARVSISGES